MILKTIDRGTFAKRLLKGRVVVSSDKFENYFGTEFLGPGSIPLLLLIIDTNAVISGRSENCDIDILLAPMILLTLMPKKRKNQKKSEKNPKKNQKNRASAYICFCRLRAKSRI